MCKPTLMVGHLARSILMLRICQPIHSMSGGRLLRNFPASLEVAGVILLLAMFGAVVLARRQIEHGEDELRRHVGLEPLHGTGDDAGGEA